jgi:ABC-type iron transport system FetAB permease component
MGLIAIPGMMTGQILGGEEPMSAVKYQQIIMFMVTASTGTGTVLGLVCAVMQEVDVKRPHRDHS